MKRQASTDPYLRPEMDRGRSLLGTTLMVVVIALCASGCGSGSPSTGPDTSALSAEADSQLEQEVAGLRSDLAETNQRVDDLEDRVKALEAGESENPEPDGDPPLDPLTPTVRRDLYPNIPEELASASGVPSGLQVLSIESGDSPADGDAWTGIVLGAPEDDALSFVLTEICGGGWLGGRENAGNVRGYKQDEDGVWWEISIGVSTVEDARVGGSSIPDDVPNDALYMGGLIRTTDQLNVNMSECGSEN